VVDVTGWVVPTPTRPRGSRRGTVGWFLAGFVAAVALGGLALVLAAGHAADLGLLVAAAGVCTSVWFSTKLPGRHGAAFVVGGVTAVFLAAAKIAYELVTTPWGF
jgi:hypothetical protein